MIERCTVVVHMEKPCSTCNGLHGLVAVTVDDEQLIPAINRGDACEGVRLVEIQPDNQGPWEISEVLELCSWEGYDCAIRYSSTLAKLQW